MFGLLNDELFVLKHVICTNTRMQIIHPPISRLMFPHAHLQTFSSSSIVYRIHTQYVSIIFQFTLFRLR
jgi:hypothetical protein